MQLGGPLLVVVGPTASGKSELALRLAELHNGEIISADSVQVYRHFDIGTAKPTAAERERAPHHLIDIVDPTEAMDAARWATLADLAIREVLERGRLPIVCGGSFLWVKSLVFGLSPMPAADPVIRARLRALATEQGNLALHAQLASVDPVAAARLNPNDFVRVSRALEVHELTGVPLSLWQEQHQFKTQRYAATFLGVERSREQLDALILARTRAMLEQGWVDEVRALLALGYAECRAMQAVGYRQIGEALAVGAAPNEHELCLTIVRATRVFARRQRTWLRDQPVKWMASGQGLLEGSSLALLPE